MRFNGFCFFVLISCSTVSQLVFAQDDTPDPTVPTPQIREKLVPQESKPTVSDDVGQQTMARVAAQMPQLKLKSFVMSIEHHATATFEFDGQTYLLSLAAELYRKPVTIPKNQFSSVPDGDVGDEQNEGEENHVQILDPHALQLSENFLICVSFDERSVVFRDLETGRLILVR